MIPITNHRDYSRKEIRFETDKKRSWTHVKFMEMINILTLPGSLRKNSSSNLVIDELEKLFAGSVAMTVFDTGVLPHFNDPQIMPPAVLGYQKAIQDADAVLICTPEYAFGVPGTLKNALDWTVGSGEFLHKTVALITASSSGQHGHNALLLVLEAIAADVSSDCTLLIPNVRAKFSKDGRVNDPQTIEALQSLATAMLAKINFKKA